MIVDQNLPCIACSSQAKKYMILRQANLEKKKKLVKKILEIG